ncbi:hypothetical protein D9M71_183000 [compost metagenome]
MGFPGRCEHVDHQGTGVGRGDKKHDDHQHRHERHHARQREMLEKLEQRQRCVLVDDRRQFRYPLVEDHVDSGIAEYRHPQQGEASWHEKDATDEFADGSAT